MIVTGIIASNLRKEVDSDFSSVKVLLGFNGVDESTTIIDESLVGRTFTAFGNAKLDNADVIFGPTSLDVDGISSSRVTTPDAADLELGSGDFTLEGWVNFDTDPAAFFMLFGKWQSDGNKRSYAIFRDGAGADLELFLSANGSASIIKITADFTVNLNQDYHIAADFDGTTYRLYVDGSVVGSATGTVTLDDDTAGFSVGAQFDGAGNMNAQFDEVRLTVGVARYAGAFTAPTAQFPRF